MEQRLDRRSLLKFFGVGASIIPILGGEPVMAAQAKLIEEPKVELLSAPAPLIDPLAYRLNQLARTLLYDENGVIDGKQRHFIIHASHPNLYSHLILADYRFQPHLPADLYLDLQAPLYIWTGSALHWKRIESF